MAAVTGYPSIADIDAWIRDLTADLPRDPTRRYEFYCHPDVIRAIQLASDTPFRPPYPVPLYGGTDVIAKPELGSGAWELYADGELIKSGRLVSGAQSRSTWSGAADMQALGAAWLPVLEEEARKKEAAMKVRPYTGAQVLYELGSGDAEEINRRRRDADVYRRMNPVNHTATGAGQPGRTGHIAHSGNGASAGDVYPAMVVRDWDEPAGTVNLQVFLDGNDTLLGHVQGSR